MTLAENADARPAVIDQLTRLNAVCQDKAVPLTSLRNCADDDWAILGACLDLSAQSKIGVTMQGIYLL